MELNLRTVMVLLGALVMLGILIDGFRRMRRARQEALKLDVKGDFKFPEEGFSSELPNGGARIIGERTESELLQDAESFRHQLDDLPVMNALDQIENKAVQELDEDIQKSLHEDRIYAGEPDFQHESYEHDSQQQAPLGDQESELKETELKDGSVLQSDESKLDAESNAESGLDYASEKLVPKAKPLNLDEHVPLLMDVEELGEELAPQVEHYEELSSVEKPLANHNVVFPDDVRDEDVIELGLGDIPAIEASVAGIADILAPELEVPELDIPVVENNQDDGRQHAEEMMAQAAYAPVKKPGSNAEKLSDRSIPSLVLVTHVIPHDEEGFCGEDILYLVNSCDLRHGEKEIFHRFEKENGEGRIQFSMANSFNPGTFNTESLLHERIHGLSLFMSLPGPEKAMDAFEAMTEMASVIARNLGGDVHDESHSIMALQTIEHNRQQVHDFVRKQKLADKK